MKQEVEAYRQEPAPSQEEDVLARWRKKKQVPPYHPLPFLLFPVPCLLPFLHLLLQVPSPGEAGKEVPGSPGNQ